MYSSILFHSGRKSYLIQFFILPNTSYTMNLNIRNVANPPKMPSWLRAHVTGSVSLHTVSFGDYKAQMGIRGKRIKCILLGMYFHETVLQGYHGLTIDRKTILSPLVRYAISYDRVSMMMLIAALLGCGSWPCQVSQSFTVLRGTVLY